MSVNHGHQSTVDEAHNLTDHLEQELHQELPKVSLTIHVEPHQPQFS